MKPLIMGMMKYLPPSQLDKKKEWRKRFFALFPHSTTTKARLDWYQSKNEYEEAPVVRRTLFIEEIVDITNGKDHRMHCFELNTLRTPAPYRFCVASKKELEEWMTGIKRLMLECKENMPAEAPKGGENNIGAGVYTNELWSYNETPEEFPVTVGETESAVACQITKRPLTLQLYSQCFTLKERKTDDVLYVWPYVYIRRYGRNNQSFTFEAGRRCPSGQGVFIIQSPEAEAIFKHVHEVAKQARGGPQLPSRQYEAVEAKAGHNDLQANDKQAKSKSLPKKPKPPAPAKSPKKVPVAENYSEPKVLGSAGGDSDSAYSSVDEVRHFIPVTKVQEPENYQYAVPHKERNYSMASVAMKIKSNKITATEDAEYDDVNLGALKLACNSTTGDDDDDDEETSYGKLYSTAQNPPTRSKLET